MPFINVGSGADLILSVPTRRTQNWDTDFLDNFATPITSHDHTGSGSGRLITTAAITVDAINDTLILLRNNQYLRARNAADSANLNTIKANASDKLEIGIEVANLNMINDVYITMRNNADSAAINVIKVNTSDKIQTGADFNNLALINNTYMQVRNNADSAYINALKVNASDFIELGVKSIHNGTMRLLGERIEIAKTFTLADNQSAAANITGLTLTETAGKAAKLIYGIYIDATVDLIEKGELNVSYDGTNWDIQREYSHDDSLVIFSIASGQLKYTTPAYTGYADGTLTYQLIEL